MLVSGDRLGGGSDIVRPAAIRSMDRPETLRTNCSAFATENVAIKAILIDTVAVLAPRDWGNPGFSGESRAE